MKNFAKKLAEHLREYLLLYVIITIIVSVFIGYYWNSWFVANKSLVKNLIIILAILTLYPSMVQLKVEKLWKELKEKFGVVLMTLILIFIIVPITAIILANFIAHKFIALGFVIANLVPASSSALAYVLLAGGNIELAAVLVMISILLTLIALPAYASIYASSLKISIPLGVMLYSITLALIVPLVLGQITRHFLVKRKAKAILKNPKVEHPCKKLTLEKISVEEVFALLEDALECLEGRIYESIKPYLSLLTMISMLFFIGLLIATKADLLVTKPVLAWHIIFLELVIYFVTLAILFVVTKLLHITYEDHTAMAFISITKNPSVAAVVAIMSIGAAAAIPAALIPVVQPVIALIYVWILPKIKHWF